MRKRQECPRENGANTSLHFGTIQLIFANRIRLVKHRITKIYNSIQSDHEVILVSFFLGNRTGLINFHQCWSCTQGTVLQTFRVKTWL